jgi:hypothetical protein
MKTRLSDGAGYLVIDHTNSPGLTPDDVAGVPGAIAVAGGTQLERDIMQCKHCQRGVVLEPARVRARAVCPHCHAYICDGCEAERVKAGGACVPFAAVFDRAHEVAVRFAGQIDHPDAQTSIDALTAPAAPRIALTDI